MRSWILIAIVVWSAPIPASQETHGGNGYTAQFFSILDSLTNLSYRSCYSSLPKKNDFERLKAIRLELEIQTQPWVSFQGKYVGAINKPQREPQLVILSEMMWKESDRSQKRALVLHEMIHLLGYREESSYIFSAPILNCINEIEKPSLDSFFPEIDVPEIQCLSAKTVILDGTDYSELSEEDWDYLEKYCGPLDRPSH